MHHLSENIENLISVLVFLRMSWERSWTGLALSSIAAFRASKPPTGRSRVRKFRFGQDDDEEDIDYNLRLLDVPGFICSSRYFNRCSEGSCCFVPFRILSGIFNNFLHLFTEAIYAVLVAAVNYTNVNLFKKVGMSDSCVPFCALAPRLQQLAVSAKVLDKRLETRLGGAYRHGCRRDIETNSDM